MKAAWEIANDVRNFDLEAEALRHALEFFTEAATLCDGMGYDELWQEHIMAKMAWNNLPALHQIIHLLTAEYLRRVAELHAAVTDSAEAEAREGAV